MFKNVLVYVFKSLNCKFWWECQYRNLQLLTVKYHTILNGKFFHGSSPIKVVRAYWKLSWPAHCNHRGQHSLTKHSFVCYTPLLHSWPHSQPRALLMSYPFQFQMQASQPHFQLKLCTPQLGVSLVKIC